MNFDSRWTSGVPSSDNPLGLSIGGVRRRAQIMGRGEGHAAGLREGHNDGLSEGHSRGYRAASQETLIQFEKVLLAAIKDGRPEVLQFMGDNLFPSYLNLSKSLGANLNTDIAKAFAPKED